jgi:hypothetical protein
MKNAIAAKPVTSIRIDPPIGTPRRSCAASATAVGGRSPRPKIAKRPVERVARITRQAISACIHITMAVDTAATHHAQAGMPGPAPCTSSVDSGTFSARPANCSAITALGRDTALLKPR